MPKFKGKAGISKAKIEVLKNMHPSESIVKARRDAVRFMKQQKALYEFFTM